MKNKSGSRTKRLFKSLFNVRSWIDFDRIKSAQGNIANMCRIYFVPNEKSTTESFEEAQARLKLTESDLLARQKGLLRLSIIMLAMAIVICVYGLYNIFYGHFVAWFMSWMVMSLALVLAFRYHFWYFQIKQRKLGCTINEWLKLGLWGK